MLQGHLHEAGIQHVLKCALAPLNLSAILLPVSPMPKPLHPRNWLQCCSMAALELNRVLLAGTSIQLLRGQWHRTKAAMPVKLFRRGHALHQGAPHGNGFSWQAVQCRHCRGRQRHARRCNGGPAMRQGRATACRCSAWRIAPSQRPAAFSTPPMTKMPVEWASLVRIFCMHTLLLPTTSALSNLSIPTIISVMSNLLHCATLTVVQRAALHHPG